MNSHVDITRRLIENDFKRWYPLKRHQVQEKLVTDNVRFKVVPAGRRSGKTERLKRYVAREMMYGLPGYYFLCAPTYTQVKRIFWEDMKKLCIASLPHINVLESELSISMPGGQTLLLIGLDKPARFEGIPWVGGGVDEIAEVKEDAWKLNIKPALDTVHPDRPNHRAWCWLIGVPDGLNHYFDLAEYARTSGDPDWKVYKWKSSDILPVDVIESAKRTMSLKQFKQEYEASFETASSRVYEEYGDSNETDRIIKTHEQLLWMHDFNYSPMSSAIAVRDKDALYICDEIILESSTARESALEFVERYSNHDNKNVIIYGDPAGRAGEKHGHVSDYTEIEEILRHHKWKLERRVKAKAPAIKNRQNSVRARIKNAYGDRFLFVNTGKCRYTHKGMQTTQLKEGSTFLEMDSKYQHITTAVGYCIDYEWPIKIERDIKVKPSPTVHRWN